MTKRPVGNVEQIDTETMEAPPRRLADAVQVHSVATRLAESDEPRDLRRKSVAGLLNRHRPMSQRKLDALGQGHRANVNYGKAESVVRDVEAVYWDIATNVPTLVNVTVKDRDLGDPAQRQEWGRLISARIHELLDDEWDEFYFELSMMLNQFVYYGVGPVVFPDRNGWKFKAWKAGGVLVPNKVAAKVSEWRIVASPGIYTVDELFGFYQNEASSDRGWNRDAIRAVLENVYASQDTSYETGKWEGLHQKLQNGDLHESVKMGEVDVWHVYVREFDGTVTHHIVPAYGATDARNRRKNEPVALYTREGEYDSMSDFLLVFFRDYGDGSYHSIRGVGDKIYAHGQLDNRMLNNVADMLAWSSSIVLQSSGVEGADEELPKIKVGPVTVLPRQYTVVDSLAGTQLNSQIAGLNLFQRQLTANVKVHQSDALDQTGRRAKSATQAAIDSQEQANLQKSEITFFQKQLDKLYRNLVGRLLKARDKAAKQVREDLLAEGVPPEALKMDALKVKAGRSIGYGSTAQRQQIIGYLDAHMPMFDEAGQTEALRLGLSAVGGQELVDVFLERIGEPRPPTTDATLIGIENAMLQQGYPLPVGVDQLHLMHIEGQLPPLVEAARSAQQQGVDRAALARFLEAGIPHVQNHIAYATQNPATRDKAAPYSDLTQNLEGVLRQLTQQLREEARAAQQAEADLARAQAQQAQMDQETKFRIEAYRIDREIELEQKKEAALHELRMFREQGNQEVSEREALFKRQKEAMKEAGVER